MIRNRMIIAAVLAACTFAACETTPEPVSPDVPAASPLSATEASKQFGALQKRAADAMNRSYVEYLDFLSAQSGNFESIATRCTPGETAANEDKATCDWLSAAAAFELIPLSENAPGQEDRASRAKHAASAVVEACVQRNLTGTACDEARVISALAGARVPAARFESWRSEKISLDTDGIIAAFADFADSAPDWAGLTGNGADLAGSLTLSMCRAEARTQAQFLNDPRFQDISRSSRRALAAAARNQNVELTPTERNACDSDPQGGVCLNALAGAIRANCPPD